MSATPQSVPSAVPSAVAPSTNDSVAVNSTAILGPYKPMSGSSYVPAVPRSDEPDPEMPVQPSYATTGTTGEPLDSGNDGAPSVPGMNGVLYTAGPIDPHYVSEAEDSNPYAKVNNPPTRGMLTIIKAYANHIGLGSQNKTTTGFLVSGAQQRTSYMRVTPPPHGAGFAPETFTPKQLPQTPYTQRFLPVTGPGDPGTLNSQTFGAGQTAGGIGGNNYTPSPGPPETTSTAQNSSTGAGMPSWG